jgi:hypothetical protein
MNTVHAPKNLSDVRHQDQVHTLKNGQTVETESNRWFHELFHPTDPVFVRYLFSEDGKKVYECYQDAGSVDYLYIIA